MPIAGFVRQCVASFGIGGKTKDFDFNLRLKAPIDFVRPSNHGATVENAELRSPRKQNGYTHALLHPEIADLAGGTGSRVELVKKSNLTTAAFPENDMG